MDSAWLNSAIEWIGAHPVAAGALIALIAFCDALVVVGIVVPALPLLIAVGTLVGLGHINGPYAVACAATGAFAGDALSYWVGSRWGPQMRQRWPFSHYPQWLDRGESMFRRHGTKSIFTARFVGAVRPFVPAIAGMLHMPFRRYALTSAVACIGWAVLFLAPGWVLGASYNAVAAVADRLALVLGGLVAAVALVWACVLYTWRWFAEHADSLLARALQWSREHPRLGRYTGALINPNRPESPSLLLLAVCLLAIGWAWFALLASLLASDGPLALDLRIHALMLDLRNPLADPLMAAFASLGDAPVLGSAAAVVLGYLLWRRRWMAAAHWLAAIVFGLSLTALLDAAIDMPRPDTAPAGFGFPSVAVTMTTVVFGFFAVLIARELPGRTRVWPYLVAGAVTTVVAFARLYLGAHWASDLVGGTLFGILWLLALGIAYRRHVARSFWIQPLSWLFYGTFVAASLWHAPRAADRLLERFTPALTVGTVALADWWRDGWTGLPAHRNESDPRRRWAFDVQVAGPLQPLRARLEAQGWRAQPQATWVDTVALLDDAADAAPPAVLPATHDTRAEALLMLRPAADGRLHALRLWPAPVRLDGRPLWLGTSQTLTLTHPLGLFALWRPEPDDGDAHALVRQAVIGLDVRESMHPHGSAPVLRIRIDPPPASVEQ
jgi:membrane protein DedA with SNARE-associated domain/membrane-associated phospholipid phosphatase